MEKKKLALLIVGIIILIALAVGAWFLVDRTRVRNTPPPTPATTQNTEPEDASPAWRLYESSTAKYGITLPPSWFIDQDAAIGGGSSLLFSNASDLDVSNPKTVVVEVFPNMKRKSGDSLFAAIKNNGKKDGVYGQTSLTATSTGYEMFKVEHAYGSVNDGPGYAIARSKTEYVYIVASSAAEMDTVEHIVSSIVFYQ